jgi:single-stranded-DNA-specific exonuclease
MVKKELETALKFNSERIYSNIDKDIFLISRRNCDGLVAGTILSTVLLKLDARFTFRTIDDLDPDTITRIISEDHDFNIFIDLNTEDYGKIKNLNDKFLIIDHNIISRNVKEYGEYLLNPYIYGINGKTEISAGGLAYLIAEKLHKGNKKLSLLAIVSALAEKQDIGIKKSLIGLNSEIASIASSTGSVNIKTDLVFNSIGHKPIHEALAYNISAYIEGVTWNKENCYKILTNSGINTQKNGKFRTFAEISEEEKNIILDGITKFIFLSSKNNRNKGVIENISNDLVNQLFEFVKEDNNSILHDGREFAFVINACIRNMKAELAIGICMGERNDTLIETEQLTNSYKANIINAIEKLFKEKWRLIDNGLFVFINGEGILSDDNVKEMVQILSESITLRKKWLFLRTLSNDNNYKFYSIKGNNCDLKFNIDPILKQYPYIICQTDKNFSNVHILKVSYSKIEDITSIIRKEISKYESEPS